MRAEGMAMVDFRHYCSIQGDAPRSKVSQACVAWDDSPCGRNRAVEARSTADTSGDASESETCDGALGESELARDHGPRLELDPERNLGGDGRAIMPEWVAVAVGVAYGAVEGARVLGTRPSVPSQDLLRLSIRVGIRKRKYTT